MPAQTERKSRKRPADVELRSSIDSAPPAKIRRSDRSVTRLDLSGKWHEKIPRDHLKPQTASKYLVLKLSCNYKVQLTEEIKNFTNLKELDASECGIQRLPSDLGHLKSIEKLSLFGNPQLSDFPEAILRLEAMTELNLGQCGMQEIPKEICELNKLEKLNLRGNRKLRQIPVELFRLTTLRELNLGECGLTILPSELRNLKQLEKLQMFGNGQLRSIPDSVFHLKSLKELDVGACGLTLVPAVINSLSKLQSLLLDGNRELRPVPLAELSMCALKELSIARCGVSSISEDIGNLKKLEKLQISGNRELKRLPQSLYTLTKLRELKACDCNLTNLENLGKLKKLRSLYLRGNEELRQMPSGIMDLAQLLELDLSCCGLVIIDHNFSPLKKLKKLHLCDNPRLGDLPVALELPKNLEELDISRCGVKEMNISFERLKKLRTLLINGCGRMEPQLMEKLPLATLKELDVSGCNITAPQIMAHDLQKRCPQLVKLSLGSNAFFNANLDKIFQLKKVEELDISGCNLMQLPDVGDAGTRLKSLDVHGNTIEKLPLTPLRHLEHLRELNLSSCQLADIPEEISELKYLVVLNVSKNRLSTLPNSVKKIYQLEVLDLSENTNIKRLPSVVSALKALKNLNISLCPVSHLPRDFNKMTELELLTAQNIGLNDYPNATLKLISLTKLDLSNRPGVESPKNFIKELPVNIVETMLEELLLTGNPVTKPPPNILEQGMPAIRKYLHDIIPGGRLVCAETVNMLGSTGAGKTSIVESLRDRRPRLADEKDRTRVMKQVRVQFLNEKFVNINDFGGHAIYQTVLPMFLPLTGIGILAYNMAENIEVQKKKVRSWIITLLAKSPGMRLIVAGTHADLISPEARDESEKEIKSLVEELFQMALNDINDHVITLECEIGERNGMQAKIEGNGKKLAFLKNALDTLKEGKRSYVSLSCKEDTDSGFRNLYKAVSQMIKPADHFPASWYHVMKDIMVLSVAESSSYIEWKQVEDIFYKYVPREESQDKLKIILRYLVNTSQIIWLEDHPTLGEHIFHCIDHMLEMCKTVLHHDKPSMAAQSGKDRMPETLKDDADRYSCGHLSGIYLNYLLKNYSTPVRNTMTELMLHFNLISRVNECKNSVQYIIPSRLEDSAPEVPSTANECQLRPNVLIRMRFFSSTMPLALFETCMASVLTWIHGNGISPKCWKHGVCFRADGVMLSYLRTSNTLEVKASADGPQKLWKFLHPVLKTVAEHVLNLWKGALPQCALVCPGCRCCGTHSRDTDFQWKFSLDDLTSTEEFAENILFCKACKQRIPISDRMSSRKGFTSMAKPPETEFCFTCSQDIPRSLRMICLPKSIEDKDCTDVSNFTKKLVEICPKNTNVKQRSILKKQISKASAYLIDELDKHDAQCIVDALRAQGLDDANYETFQALPTRNEKVRHLINEIIMHKPDNMAKIMLKILESEVQRMDLAEYIRTQAVP